MGAIAIILGPKVLMQGNLFSFSSDHFVFKYFTNERLLFVSVGFYSCLWVCGGLWGFVCGELPGPLRHVSGSRGNRPALN